MRAFAPVAGYDYNLCHLLSSTCRLCVFCAGAALCRQNLMGEEKSQCHAVGRHFSQTKKMCVSTFLPRSERPAFRAVSLSLGGAPGFNGATLPLHLPARILQAECGECHSAYLCAHSLKQLAGAVGLQTHTPESKQTPRSMWFG